MKEDKIKALAQFKNVEPHEITEAGDENLFEHDNIQYFVLSDEEATAMAQEEYRQSLWAFRANVIVDWMVPYSHTLNDEQWQALIKAIQQMQEALCEGANTIIESLLGGNVDDLINWAIEKDGRAHALSHYDGNEYESGDYFIYIQG